MSEVVLICGSRDWTAKEPIRAFIQALEPESLVVHGNARGADRIAGWITVQEGHHAAAIPALWDRYGKSAAGPRRNRAMALLAPALSRAAAFPYQARKAPGAWCASSSTRTCRSSCGTANVLPATIRAARACDRDLA
jgi:hypothetical protein